MKDLLNYLLENSIDFEFHKEMFFIKRSVMNFEIKQVINELRLAVTYLDTLIVIENN